MKRLFIGGIIALAVGLSAPPTTRAQGTTYLSNLGATPTGSIATGSDFWVAVQFVSGTNSGGYALDSIQLAMVEASGTPGGFSVMLYSDAGIIGPRPGTILATLTGSPNPSTAGVYIYDAPADLILSPGTPYDIVLTSGTPVPDGAYQWSETSTFSYSLSDGWNGIFSNHSADGSSWRPGPGGCPLFAIDASPVPEPCVLAIFGLGGLWLVRRKFKAVE